MARKSKNKGKLVYNISEWLLIVGGLAWGFYGLFERFSLVEYLFGTGSLFSNIVLTIVGVAAVYLAIYKLSMMK